MAIYLKIPGVDGNVTTSGFQNWIEVGSFEYASGRQVKTITGRTTDRESTHPSFSALSVNKLMDKSSPHLLQKMCEGKSLDQVQLQICKSNNSAITPFLKYTLHNVIISHRSVTSNGSANPIENLTLSFTKIEESYVPFDKQNQQQSPITAGYDLETAAVM